MSTIVIIALVAWMSIPQLRVRLPSMPKSRRTANARRRPQIDMGMVLTEVATRLRSGQDATASWQATLAGYGLRVPSATSEGSQSVLDDEGVPRALIQVWRAPVWRRMRMGVSKATLDSLPDAFAVCRLSYSTGAPMAEILEACARGLTESGESRSARDVALAGPITSARMLAALPLAGVVLASLAGIDPIGFFATSVGRVVLLGGLMLEGLGIYLTWRLVRQAKEAEADE